MVWWVFRTVRCELVVYSSYRHGTYTRTRCHSRCTLGTTQRALVTALPSSRNMRARSVHFEYVLGKKWKKRIPLYCRSLRWQFAIILIHAKVEDLDTLDKERFVSII
uniref:uncharacterized protein LOC127071112 n=1 Tax=Vespula vulgaris TaxID=7454 RepID=UPI002141C309|nr:uncharacterized protein LOC127071112 [Vespula vulgaris]